MMLTLSEIVGVIGIFCGLAGVFLVALARKINRLEERISDVDKRRRCEVDRISSREWEHYRDFLSVCDHLKLTVEEVRAHKVVRVKGGPEQG